MQLHTAPSPATIALPVTQQLKAAQTHAQGWHPGTAPPASTGPRAAQECRLQNHGSELQGMPCKAKVSSTYMIL